MKNKLLLILSSIFSMNLVSAQITDPFNEAKGLFGGFSLGGIWTYLGYGILILVVAGVIAFFVRQKVMDKKFNKTISFFKRNSISGGTLPDKNIQAMTVRLDSFGNLGYRLKTPYETKNLMPKLKYELKPNHHYVEYCEDNRIVEIVSFGDYDDERKKLGVTFSDHNTELARSSMHQMNKERYEKTNFWKENATLLVNIGAIVIIMVFLWLIADKLIDVISGITGAVDKTALLQETQVNIIDKLDKLISTMNVIK